MLYLITGNAHDRRSYINETIVSTQGNPAAAMRISSDDLVDAEIDSLVTTQSGLFGDQEVFIFADLARVLPLRNILQDYAHSPNLFFFSEATVTKKIQDEFSRVSAEYKEFQVEPKAEKKEVTIFSLSDALGARDKKTLWLNYQKERDRATPEEIIGVLVWQVKNMLMVYENPAGPEGMKPFVLNKTKRYLQKYRQDELKEMMVRLVTLFHNRLTHYPLDVQLERFILSL